MYAVIRAGGHQEKVAPGEQITVDHLKQDVGEEVTFTPLLVAKGDGTVVSDPKAIQEQSASVVGKIVQHLKGDKLDIFQYRQKTGYRRHVGHRQPLTLVEIAEIRLGGEVFTAPEPAAEPEPAPAGAAAPKPAKKAPAKAKTAATKPAAKTPAKKTQAKKAPGKKAPAKKK